MAAKKKFQEQLAALDQMRGDRDAALATLPRQLRDKSSFLVGKAARLAADLNMIELIPDLCAALDRFYTDEDKQCWAKNGLVDALTALGYAESTPYLRGIKHIQKEPVYGGAADTAGPLRARCCVALVDCRDLRDVEVLRYLLEALVDEEKTVRVEAARAIGRIARDEAGLLLRLRVLTGDKEPEVMGACFTALLAIEGSTGIGFVEQFLEKEEATAGEAAIALGLTHDPAVFPILKRMWEANRRRVQLAAVVLTAMGVTNLPEAIAFLIERVEAGSIDALEALAAARITDQQREEIRKAVESSGGSRLHSLFEKRLAR